MFMSNSLRSDGGGRFVILDLVGLRQAAGEEGRRPCLP